MAETQEQTIDEQQPEQEEPHGTDWKAEAQKWEKRAKANKAKADQWDAQEEAGRTELQKAQELAAKYKAQLDEVNAAKERGEQVKAAAEKYRVDSDMLARMGGDVDENAKWLSEHLSTKAYPQTRDRGEYAAKQKGTSGAAQAARVLFARD